ncbi:MAG: aspartate--tRNA ligase [Clostridia bacterium]|nr:aspartate--tRNA ligase [Oscillospiraceae bacterium]MBR4892622.1 aspartate--tRNA ligase [Clostridia bacterium]
MAENIKGLKRTSRVAELSSDNIGEEVTLMGWVHNYRNLGSLLFIDLRDVSGICQIYFGEDCEETLKQKAATLRKEFVIAIKGTVLKRGGAVNPNLKTGEIEVKVTELRILSKAETPPFAIEENSDANEALRLKYRYLDLRRADMKENLILRHKVAKSARDYYDMHGFLEIETPMLTKSTPEGARDYLVPSRVHPNKFYALPQSPQQYKQLLMLSSMDRYMQIAKCFRDEDLRADRQPEFTQIDLEMSFVNEDDVIEINEGFIKHLFKDVMGMDVKTPFLRLPYKDAMDKYGSDKPDLRYGMELCDISDILSQTEFNVFSSAINGGGSVRCIKVDAKEDKTQSLSRKEIDALTEFVKTYGAKGLAYMIIDKEGVRSSVLKFLKEEEIKGIVEKTNAQEGDILLIVADKNSVVYNSLGALRCHVADKLGIINKDEFNFLWIVDFPLFEYDEEENRFVAKHHPFTSPKDDDIDLLDTDPENVRAKAYDMVLNGCEIGGGSIRIFDTELQQKMFEKLGFTKEQAWAQFGHLMEAFKYGTPPHGGMAYGLDRLVMLLAKKDSIRDVIAFPKVQNASELMTDAPNLVDDKQLNELYIKCVKPQ